MPGDSTGCWSWLLRRASTGHAGSSALRLLPVRSGSEARGDAPLPRDDAPLPRGDVPLPPSGSGRLPAHSRTTKQVSFSHTFVNNSVSPGQRTATTTQQLKTLPLLLTPVATAPPGRALLVVGRCVLSLERLCAPSWFDEERSRKLRGPLPWAGASMKRGS